MARRFDTGWRDGLLAVRHAHWGHDFPVAGMKFPTIEYDRGKPVAVISYQRRGDGLPTGHDAVAAHDAFAHLFRPDGLPLPSFTALYDTRNWAYRLFAHNDTARSLFEGTHWTSMTEVQFADLLYRLRGRIRPDLSQLGVTFAEEPWLFRDPEGPGPRESWPHEHMSVRRRNFEPVGQTRMTWRNPVLDIDLAVVDRSRRLAMVVDYKAPGVRVNPDSTNVAALSQLYTRYTGTGGPSPVPAFLVQYQPARPQWGLRAMCLNPAARSHLSYVLGGLGDVDTLAEVVAGPRDWVDLSELQWREVLNCARGL